MTDAPADSLVLRHWPTRFTFVGIGLLLFAMVAVMARKATAMEFGDRPELVLLAWSSCLVLLALGAGAFAKVRERLVLDDEGLTMVRAFKRDRLEWPEVTRWEVESGPRRWLVRAWCGDRSVVVFRLMLPAGFGTSTITDETYAQPPRLAPDSVHKTFDQLVVHWQVARDER